MKTIILPGFSLSNKEWAHEVKNKVKLDGPLVVHEWLHWKSGRQSLSLKKEIEAILKLVGEEEINFISKSVGTRVTVNLLPFLKRKINKIIFCGIPLRGFGEKTREMFRQELSSFPHQKLLIFQNDNDPWGKYKLVKEFVKNINQKIKITEKERSDHNYPYYSEFEDFLKQK
jgi:Alpha/beta hydrolase domain